MIQGTNVPSPNLRVVHVSPEILPFAKTGGLADMVGSIGPALLDLGASPLFILPKYRTMSSDGFHPLPLSIKIPMGGRMVEARAWEGLLVKGLKAFVIDIPEFFDRPGIYGERGRDYPDNVQRFAAFCLAALELIKAIGRPAQVIHVHDWQTALIPVYLMTTYADDAFFRGTRSLLTIHNIGYQGLFPASDFRWTGLEDRVFSPEGLEFWGLMNLLKGGIVTADALTTVSPNYATEVLTTGLGYGLEGVLHLRKNDFCGILNGIDIREWDPENDPHLPAAFSVSDRSGKAECKRLLQEEMGLSTEPTVPLIAVVSRFVDQKGIDLIAEAIPLLASERAQWVILGNGMPEFEERIARVAQGLPSKVVARIGFDQALSHRIEAGADFFLMPSRYEPCGYNQMYSQRYGTIPIARATGGLKDTVTDNTQEPGRGTGFLFDGADVESIREAVLRALACYDNREEFLAVQGRALLRDFSWKASAKAYMDLYRRVLAAPRRKEL